MSKQNEEVKFVLSIVRISGNPAVCVSICVCCTHSGVHISSKIFWLEYRPNSSDQCPIKDYDGFGDALSLAVTVRISVITLSQQARNMTVLEIEQTSAALFKEYTNIGTWRLE